MKNYFVLLTLIASLFFSVSVKAQHYFKSSEIAIAGKYNIHMKPILRNEHIEWEVNHNFPMVTHFQVALATNTDTIEFSNAHLAKAFSLPKLMIDMTSEKVQLLSFNITFVEFGQSFTLKYDHALQSFTMYKDGVYYQYANNYALLNNSASIERQHIASRE